jgi:hypothetical protein
MQRLLRELLRRKTLIKLGEANTMTIETSQPNQTDRDSPEIVVPQEQEGTELYDSPTPDSYDPHITPAETAARKEREGDNFKQIQHPEESDSIDTTRGFTVDKEGLVDNFAVEPAMYYETPGDVPKEKSSNPEQSEI